MDKVDKVWRGFVSTLFSADFERATHSNHVCSRVFVCSCVGSNRSCGTEGRIPVEKYIPDYSSLEPSRVPQGNVLCTIFPSFSFRFFPRRFYRVVNYRIPEMIVIVGFAASWSREGILELEEVRNTDFLRLNSIFSVFSSQFRNLFSF